MLPLRYGHCDGHTDLCYSSNSTSFISCGSEGDVRVWENVNDTDQKDLCIGEKAWAVCQKGKTLYVATDKNIVQAYTFPDLELDGIITRFTAPVTQIDISPCEKKLAAGSCDMDIHVVDMDTMDSKTLSGHKAPILSISLDPRLSFLASSSCDGSVKIWNIVTGEVLHQWDSVVEKCNSFERSTSLCRLHFQPIHGHFLAVPNKNKINIYARESWALTKTLSQSTNEHTFSVVRYSKCGKYIAGGTTEGHIFIFNVATEKLTCQTMETGSSGAQSITAISWHPQSTGVVYSNLSGQIGELLLQSSSDISEARAEIEDMGDIPLGVPDFEDDDDEDSENVISLEKIKAESGFGPERFTSSPIKKDDKDDKESLISERLTKYEPKIPFAEFQEPFQPSSTPSHLQERFLLWNNVGIVRGFTRDDDSEELDIEFHDTTLHHGFRMNNNSSYSLAALTQQVLVLVAPRLPDMPSKVCCILLKAWDGQKEWEASLGTEDGVGVTAGKNWIAVVTDRLLLRVFSIDGTQSDVVSIPGPLVSLSGHHDQLTVYFHTAQGKDRDQYISFMQVSINTGTKLATVVNISPLPITPASSVKWVGFSDEGSPATLDSEGFLRLLYNKQWRPVCALEDRAKGKFDHYFIIGLSEVNHTIRCILCKGAYYPPVIPKPIVNEIEWQIPLSDLDTDKGKLEEEMLRAVITVPHLQSKDDEDYSDSKSSIEKTISVTVMKLFALACKTGLESRAVSLCESMPSVEVVKLASKYAAKLGRHQLATRVSDVAAQMSEIENMRLLREREDEKQMEDDYDDRMSTASSRHLDGSSQDIFADHDKNASKLSDKENLIMKMRRKKMMTENPEIKPNILDGQKRFNKNPFKKSAQDEDESQSGEKDAPSTAKPNYIEWFNQNKSVLQSEHPLLKDNELAIVGMKKYRQLHSASKETSSPSQQTNTDSAKDTSNEETEPKKRKLSEIMTENARKKQTLHEKTVKNSETVSEKKEEKKSLEKKPVNAASKLKNFSFVKKSS